MQFRLRTLLIVLALELPVLVGCSSDPTSGKPNFIPPDAEAALLAAEGIELFSLNPTYPEADDDPEVDGEDRFHKWLVLGKTVIKDEEAKARILTALRRSVPKYDDGVRAACFWPRHGIRVGHAEKTYDFLICFECHIAVVYLNDQELDGFQIGWAKPSQQSVFDDALSRSGVPLPTKPAH